MTLWWYAKKCLGVKWFSWFLFLKSTGDGLVTVSFLSPHGVRNVCVELFWWQWMYLSVLVVICVCFSGPCGGKTTGQARLSSFFESMNWKVRHIEIRVHSNHPFIIIIRHWCDCPARMSNVWLCKKKNLIFIQHTREKASFMHIKCIRLLHKKKTDREVNTRYWTWLQN